MIRTENLTKVFKIGFRGRRVHALKNLNLDVRKGEIFGFLGPNGAGKTTTLKLLMGLIYPTSGRAWIMDEEVGDVSIKKSIGFLPETPYFYEYLTGAEFLDFYGQLFGLERHERRESIERLLLRVGLKGAEDRQLRRYSKGMIQRIGIAQAIINDPRLVVLDEPMSGLDPLGRKEVRDIIIGLKDEGKTVFFSTHILPDVEMICDRVGILIRGGLRDVGPLEDLLNTQVKSVDITVQGLSETGLRSVEELSTKIVKREGKILLTTEDEEMAEKVLQIIHKDNGRLISFIPQRESLEEHFIRQTRA